MKKKIFSVAMLAGLLVALFPTAMAPAQAALSGTPGVYIASGHDLDLHCGSTDPSDSEYSTYCGELNILVHNATTVAVPNVLALGDGSGTCFENSMSNLPDTTVEYLDISADPSVYAAKNFSAYDVIVLSSSYCSSNEFPTSVNTRTADFISYYNAGGGIIQMTNGGGGWSPEWDNDYYLAVGFHAASVEQTDPRTVTADGEAWGLTDEMVNCCATHNSFLNPPSTFTALEYDSTGIPVTIVYQGIAMPADGLGGNELEISMTLDLAPGEPIAGAYTTVSGSWLMADSPWTTTVNSTPQVVCSSVDLGNTNSYGAFTCTFPMPSNLEPGNHTVVLVGTAPDGSELTRTANFTIDASGNLVSWAYNTDLPAADAGLPNTGLTIAIIAGETLLGSALLFGAYMAFGAKGSLRFAAMDERLAVMNRKLNRLYGSNRNNR